MTLIGPTSQGEQLADLASELGTFRLDVLTDSSGDFRDTFGNAEPTLVLVRDDGVIVDVVRGVQDGDRLEPRWFNSCLPWGPRTSRISPRMVARARATGVARLPAMTRPLAR